MSSTYRLTGRTEAGELSELYEAVQEPEGLPVVIKLFTAKTSDTRYATTLAATYGVLNPLSAEGVVHVLDMGFVKNRLAVVREAVDGPSLGLALQRLNTKEVILPPSVALSLIIQILDAVDLAHGAGVVHGAITPANVLLSRDGHPHVCDFGALQALLAVPELKRAFARGRSAYRAPEVGKGGEPTSLSDLYSIGAIAYELLTLREAVIGDGGGGVSTRRAALPPPSRLDRRLHAKLDPIILRALEATPTRRYGSCAEMAQALRGFLSNQGGLPGAEDVRRFITELVPNGVSLTTPGPVPFAEAFPLTPISGVSSLAQLRADALEKSVVARVPFSPAPNDADTMDAPPAFEEYHPSMFPDTPPPGIALAPPAKVLESTHIITPGEPDRTAVGTAPPGVEVTHFGRQRGGERGVVARAPERPEGPPKDDEQTWVAPPGAPPVKSTRRAPVSLSGGGEGTRIGKNPRLRLVEDFSKPAPGTPVAASSHPVDPDDLRDTDRIEVTVARQRPRPPPAPPPASVASEDYAAVPAPSQLEVPAAGGRGGRLFTEERNLLEDARRRRRMMSVAGSVAGVGLVCFAFGMWRFVQRTREEDPDPKVAAVSETVREYLREPAAPPPSPEPTPPVPVETPREDAKASQAWLTIRANRPARVYVDGVRIKRALPLVNLPVKAGDRKVVVETTGTPRLREVFEVHVQGGEHRLLEPIFPETRRR
ncbi:serine/threonine protein kinase [Archangium primigenium]|uniref:serine/threonine protein kinase n=1 Tax=[Archangium] primigenium TaxID=2792470 RepID=UPI00195B1C8D|nr:serine/threonine-protein kinase [Archangium primigenium]MBM7116547.1 protein kinase [Archangium primigenium]